MKPSSMRIDQLLTGYRENRISPSDVVKGIIERIKVHHSHSIWISRTPDDELKARAQILEDKCSKDLPLYGIPFAIKDNFDATPFPTTAGCPEYSYRPPTSAPVVSNLLDAGAILLGKTNMDQFATGLVGTRSPYGACRNAFDPDFISGGSSSGSAVATALGQVSFALGTDTAGSGRVPAAFNNIIGLKPTRGLISTRGIVPACQSIDCVSIFSLSATDALTVLDICGTYDADDPFSRDIRNRVIQTPKVNPKAFTFGIPNPDQLVFFGNSEFEKLFHNMEASLTALGGEKLHIDLTPFLEVAKLLYDGPWVAERYTAIKDFIERSPNSLLPTTREIIEGGNSITASELFTGQKRLRALARQCEIIWKDIDILVTPTAGTIYQIADVNSDPIRLNANLGYYTNFVNLLDYSAVSVPAGFTSNGLPFGVTLVGPPYKDQSLLHIANLIHDTSKLSSGKYEKPFSVKALTNENSARDFVQIAVCGAHMSGLPLNYQLTELGGQFIRCCTTAPLYRFYALPGGPLERPGLVRQAPGASIQVEIWEIPVDKFGIFVCGIPAPLGIGQVSLSDGTNVLGFLCEFYAVSDARDITKLGDWRSYLQAET